MSIFTEEQAKAVLEKVVKLSKADQCTATLAGSIDGNIRFALNNVSTSGISPHRARHRVTCHAIADGSAPTRAISAASSGRAGRTETSAVPVTRGNVASGFTRAA